MKNIESPRSPLRTISSFGTVKRGRSSFCTLSSCPAVEVREQVEAADEISGIEADVEARRRLGVLSVLDLAREIPVDLGRDQAPFVQSLVAADFAAQR